MSKPRNRLYLVKDMDGIVSELMDIKWSARTGGLPDMHVEKAVNLIAESVDRQVLAALDKIKAKMIKVNIDRGVHGHDILPVATTVVIDEVAAEYGYEKNPHDDIAEK